MDFHLKFIFYLVVIVLQYFYFANLDKKTYFVDNFSFFVEKAEWGLVCILNNVCNFATQI